MDFQGGKGLKTHPPSTILQVAFKLDAVEWPSCFLFPFGFAGCGAASQMLHQILQSSKLPGFATPPPPHLQPTVLALKVMHTSEKNTDKDEKN